MKTIENLNPYEVEKLVIHFYGIPPLKIIEQNSVFIRCEIFDRQTVIVYNHNYDQYLKDQKAIKRELNQMSERLIEQVLGSRFRHVS